MVCLTSSKLAIVVVDLTRRRDGSSFGHQSQEKISFYFLSEVKDKVYYKVFLVIKKNTTSGCLIFEHGFEAVRGVYWQK